MKVDKEFLRNIVADIVCCNAEEIQDTTDFIHELEVTSVQMLEIVAEIEDEYDLEIKASDFSKYDTIEKIVAVLESIDEGKVQAE